MQLETASLGLALGLYLAATLTAIFGAARGRPLDRLALALVALALALHTAAIALRWLRLGHAPYVDLYEILSSNVWSLHLILALLAAALPAVRSSLAAALPVLSVLTLWLLVTPGKDTVAPVTYDTIWLPIHMILGKVFLGLTVAAVGLSLIVILRRTVGWRFSAAPGDSVAAEVAHRLMLMAVVFQTLMLAAGAAWARDAWGRYWAWDPLESWAFLTWVAVLAYLHWRSTERATALKGAVFVTCLYVLAFATFFGAPFLSTAPHQGAV